MAQYATVQDMCAHCGKTRWHPETINGVALLRCMNCQEHAVAVAALTDPAHRDTKLWYRYNHQTKGSRSWERRAVLSTGSTAPLPGMGTGQPAPRPTDEQRPPTVVDHTMLPTRSRGRKRFP